MMKIAIAGTNGLAQLLAHELETTTPHHFVFLSRRAVSGLSNKGWQVVVVDYSNTSALRFKLAGVDVVLSTISGDAQMALIEAAAAAKVGRFVPSEYSGPPSLRPANDLLDNGHRRAILRLASLESTGMKFSLFTCGILYERFGPGGTAQVQLAKGSGLDVEGSYLFNMRKHTAELPQGSNTKISMISLRNLARFVVAALKLSSWPREFKVRGDRLSIKQLVEVAESVGGRRLQIEEHSVTALSAMLAAARTARDGKKEQQVHALIATAAGRYDFAETNLNDRVDVEVERFKPWLQRVWADER